MTWAKGALAILIMISCAPGAVAGESGPNVGAAAPAFEASGLDGAKIASAELAAAGKPAVLVFWGLRCGACLEEIPSCNQLHAKYKGKVAIVGVNVDGIDALLLSDQIKKKALRIDYAVVADPEFKIADSFGMTQAPLTVVVDRKGIVRYRHQNYAAGDEKPLDDLLSGLLAESP